MKLTREESVFILSLGGDENRLNQTFLDDCNAALDEVEGSQGPAALVTTAEGKFFSNGFDLDWLSKLERDEARSFIRATQQLWGRLLVFPVPTFAAIQGHAFGAGAVHALAHDFRFMRSERGYFCFPEIDLKLRFQPGMLALIQARLTPHACRDAILTGARYGGPEAAQVRLVDEAVSGEELLSRVTSEAIELSGKDRATLRAMKLALYGDAFQLLQDEAASKP